eukprot:scaffold7957_cov55-Phaeocystis_antarctica.AAC.2
MDTVAIASAWRRHQSARLAVWAFTAGASDRAVDRSKSVAASSNSAAERGPASQALYDTPPSTSARMLIADSSFGAARKTLADSALSSSSFHQHSGLATSQHSLCCSISKAFAVASAQCAESTV